MRELDEVTLKGLIEQLDGGVPREGAVVLEREGDGIYGDAAGVVTANRRGYLRLGIEYLKAAFAAPRSEVQPHRVDIDISYIDGLQETREAYERKHFEREPLERCVFERRDDPGSGFGGREGIGVVGAAILVALGLFLLASLVVGVWTVIDRALGLLLGRY